MDEVDRAFLLGLAGGVIASMVSLMFMVFFLRAFL